MKVLVLGATGATGKLVVRQLLKSGQHVRVLVRSPEKFTNALKQHNHLQIKVGSISEMSQSEIANELKGCNAVISCLGHNLSFKGIYGPPYRLVTNAVKDVSAAAMTLSSTEKIKLVLMNTTGNRNRDLDEPISLAQKAVIGLLRLLLPPHPDNEQAAEFLRTGIGQNNERIEWVVVRPDGLIDEPHPSTYELRASPTRSAIFDPGKTSRANVAHFMCRLLTEDSLWQQWKGRMPVIYNLEI